MKILAIDTTTKFLCLGIYDGAKTYEYNLEVGPKLSSLLAVTIKRALEALNFDVQAIDYFVCGLGPGSFTGMRVGLSTIKGLAWVTNKPVIGIPTLDILAKNVDINDRLIIPVIDAKRSLIYCSVYKKQGAKLSRITPYLLITKNELFKKIKGLSIIFGDALNLYRDDILSNNRQVTLLDKDYWYPKAGNIITLALERVKGKKLSDLHSLNPLYLYPKECQIRKA